MKQVRFPRQLLTFAVVGTNAVTLVVMFAVLVPVNLIFIPETRTTFWAALPLLLPLVALAGGIALVLATLTVVFRDVEHCSTAILLPVVLPDAVFYTLDLQQISGHPHLVQLLHYGNPVAPLVIAIRDPLFFGQLPQLGDVIYVFVAGFIALAVAALDLPAARRPARRAVVVDAASGQSGPAGARRADARLVHAPGRSLAARLPRDPQAVQPVRGLPPA